MPFLAEETFKIPNKDLLSWIFDDQKHDVDKPVGGNFPRHPTNTLIQ